MKAEPAVLQKFVENAPSESAVGPTALQCEIDRFGIRRNWGHCLRHGSYQPVISGGWLHPLALEPTESSVCCVAAEPASNDGRTQLNNLGQSLASENASCEASRSILCGRRVASGAVASCGANWCLPQADIGREFGLAWRDEFHKNLGGPRQNRRTCEAEVRLYLNRLLPGFAGRRAVLVLERSNGRARNGWPPARYFATTILNQKSCRELPDSKYGGDTAAHPYAQAPAIRRDHRAAHFAHRKPRRHRPILRIWRVHRPRSGTQSKCLFDRPVNRQRIRRRICLVGCWNALVWAPVKKLKAEIKFR